MLYNTASRSLSYNTIISAHRVLAWRKYSCNWNATNCSESSACYLQDSASGGLMPAI